VTITETPRYEPKVDHMPIQAVDHLELCVGNAKQAAFFYEHALGFSPIAYAGLETGSRDSTSYVLAQGEVRLVIRSGMTPDSPIARFCDQHGDGVRRVMLRVPDAKAAFDEALKRGAEPALEPTYEEDAGGRVGLSGIRMYGDVVLGFVEREGYSGAFLPGFEAVAGAPAGKARGVGIAAIDHIVGNVELGRMNEWVAWFQKVLGFEQLQHFTDEAISTEYSALMSKVMTNGNGKIKFPINEPAEGKRKSQIDEYLEFNHGPGAQHIALQSSNIVKTVETLQQRGVLFLTTPDAYYEETPDRVGEIDESWSDLRRLKILADRDDDGYLLQIFTKTAQDRPTLFFEVIERHGARGFGDGNFKALFEAIEREQALRGNL